MTFYVTPFQGFPNLGICCPRALPWSWYVLRLQRIIMEIIWISTFLDRIVNTLSNLWPRALGSSLTPENWYLIYFWVWKQPKPGETLLAQITMALILWWWGFNQLKSKNFFWQQITGAKRLSIPSNRAVPSAKRSTVFLFPARGLYTNDP